MTKGQRTYSAAFRQEAVALARSREKSLAQVAQDLGMDDETLRRWVLREEKIASSVSLEGVPPAIQAELERLRKEVRVLRMERDILKKATAFFANETA
jgi:transposase